MSGRLKAIIYVLLFGALLGFTTQPIAAQESIVTRPRTVTKATSLRTIPNGEKVEIVGNIIRVQADTFSVCDMQGAETVVVLAPSTWIGTHRRGIFRGAATHDKASLLIGLKVKVEGRGNPDGQLIAKWVRFHDSDFRGETQVDTRAIPIEAEQVRLAGQLEETTMVAMTARKDAKAAQNSADKAQNTADLAQMKAATAQNTAAAAHTKIAAIDDFEATVALTVTFKAGSAVLSADDRSRLDEFAEKTVGVKGFILEISGFASKEGGPEYNHRLSARRAEAVMDYLIGVCNVPIRRIIVPYSGGTMNPVADNTTLEGRKMNRRTEVKMLVSKGLAAKEQNTAAVR